MKLPAIPMPYLIAGGAVLAAVAYIAMRGAKGTGKDIGGAAVDLVDGVIEGTVVSTGKLVGLPETSKSECQKRIEEFRAAPWYQQAYLSFGVSANCSVSDYARFITTGKGPQEQ